MGRRLALRYQPGLDRLEDRQVMTANPMVHAAIAPVAVPIATYNNTFTQIGNAFQAYEGPYDDALNAIGSVASGLVSTALSTTGITSDSLDNGVTVASSKGDPNALQGRLVTAISALPGGQGEANAILNRAFQFGGLTTSDAPYFKAKITAMVKLYVTQQVHRGEMLLVWPGQQASTHR